MPTYSVSTNSGSTMKYLYEASPIYANVSCQIDSNHYLNIFQDTAVAGGNLVAQVFTVDTTAYQIYTSSISFIISTDSWCQAASYDKSICKIDDGHSIVFWTDSAYYGHAQILAVNTSTWVVTTAGAVFDINGVGDAYFHSCALIDANHVIDFYDDEYSTNGYAQVFTINTSTWEISSPGALMFSTNRARYHSCTKLDDNHFVDFWQDVNGDGQCQVFTVNTTTWSASTAAAILEFDTTDANYNSCYFVDSTHVINYWGGPGDDGFVQVFAVDTSTWAITTAAASLEYDTTRSDYMSCNKIDANHFVLCYGGADTGSGGGQDGTAQCFTVNTTTWAITTGARFEFDTQQGHWNSVQMIDSNHFVNFYTDFNNYGQAGTFTINTSTYAISTVAAYWGLQYGFVQALENSACAIDANHYINFWGGKDADGYVQVFTVNTSTFAVTTANAFLEFDTSYSAWGSCCAVDSNHFINFWAGPGNDGFVQMFTVDTSTWAVTTANASLEFDTQNGTYNSCCLIDANHVIDFWQGPDSDGFVQVFTVDTSTWAVTTANASLEFETQSCNINSCFKVDTNHVINFWQGPDSDGFVQTFTVNTTTWAVTTANASLEFDTAQGSWAKIKQIDDTHFFVTYAGSGSDGYAEVFTIDTSTWAVTTAAARLEFDTVNGTYNALGQIDDYHFIDFWRNVGGYAEVFSVNSSTWTVKTSTAKLEFDTLGSATFGANNMCIGIDSNHFVNFGSRYGDVGYSQVFTVSSTTGVLKAGGVTYSSLKKINTLNIDASEKIVNIA